MHSASLCFTSFVYASDHPCPGERGTEKRRRNLSEPFPPPPSRCNKREREQVECAGDSANRRHPAAARCAHDSLCLSRFSNHRIRMERRHRRFLQHSVGVNRPGAFCPGSDHASALLIVCYCRGSSHRTQGLGTVAAGERSKRCFSVERPLAGLVKKKNEERRYSPLIANITADPPDNIPLCIVVRCASTAHYVARPTGLHNEFYRTCRLLWVAATRGFTLRGSPRSAESGKYLRGVAARGLQPVFILRRSSRSVLAPPVIYRYF